MKRIVSLCDYSGNWCKPYREAGYEVVQVDLKFGQDVRLLKYMPDIYGVLAAPPCTMFCQASAHLWQKRTDAQMIEGISVVDACVRFCVMTKPTFWVIENPCGQLNKWIGPPQYKFHPYEFGHPYRKLTYLWGRFNAPIKGPIVKGESYVVENVKSVKGTRQVGRSITPINFAKAFFEANQ